MAGLKSKPVRLSSAGGEGGSPVRPSTAHLLSVHTKSDGEAAVAAGEAVPLPSPAAKHQPAGPAPSPPSSPLPAPSLPRKEDGLVGGDAGGAGAGGAVPEQGGGSGQDLQGHPVRLQVHQQRPARHRAERRQVHHLGSQGLPPPQVGERSARPHQPGRQRDPSHAGLAWEVQECAAVDFPVPGPVRVARKIGDLPGFVCRDLSVSPSSNGPLHSIVHSTY
ncbi:hypothetical protein VPH35_080242 [Triticum aestivum]